MLVLPALAVALTLAACGSDDSSSNSEEDGGLTATKTYLTDHSAELVVNTAKMKAAADAYY
ncbi:MAG: hypothetical protein WBW62_01850, partial [Solirubrobacterales bacterium]